MIKTFNLKEKMHCNEEENVLFIDILDFRCNGAPIDLVATCDSRCLSNKIEIQSVEDRTDLNLKFVSMLMQMQRNEIRQRLKSQCTQSNRQ